MTTDDKFQQESEEHFTTLHKTFNDEIAIGYQTQEEYSDELIAWLMHRDFMHTKVIELMSNLEHS